MDGYGLLRRFGLARTNNTVNDGSRYVHRSLGEVDVAPFQAEQLALPQAGRSCQENQRSLSYVEIVYQNLEFSGRQYRWGSTSLRTLTDEMDRIARRSQDSTCIVLTSANSWCLRWGRIHRFKYTW